MDGPATSELARRSVRAIAIFQIVFALLLVALSWSFAYWQGWLLWLHVLAWSAFITVYFLKRDPALVARRLRGGPQAETEPTQKRIMLATSVVMAAAIVVSVLDHRFGWSAVLWPVVILGNVLIAVGYAVVFYVMKANSFAGATVTVAEDQP